MTPSLTRMTLSYDAQEDRVFMAGELDTGEIVRLGFTRRLLNNLLPHLLKSEASMLGEQETSGCESSAANALRINRGGDEPVLAPQSADRMLVTSVDLSSSEKHLVLDWKNDSEATKIRLVLSRDALPKWLQALKTCFELGAWSEEAWEPDSLTTWSSSDPTTTIH